MQVKHSWSDSCHHAPILQGPLLDCQSSLCLCRRQTRGMWSSSWVSMPALLFPLLDYWKLWFSMGLFFLLFWITWWSLRRIQHEEEEPEQQDQQVEQVQQAEQEGQEGQEDKKDNENLHDSVVTGFLTWNTLAKQKGTASRCEVVEEMVTDLLQSFRSLWSDSFFPVLQPAIGVDSTFEGWSPREEDTLYCLLVPMEAPRGHVFVLD
ncbi:uncharacterized protein LOC110390628, partial [Numida meleagris]|uniref:uncharacterized protein LOC110390628 n=1 Tax=Numida meleagris TaxID=8996 RepID=UPI000B3DB9D8